MPAELLKFRCYRCNQLLAVAPSRAGTVVACPRCKADLQIPAVEPASRAEGEKGARRERAGAVASNAATSISLPPISMPSAAPAQASASELPTFLAEIAAAIPPEVAELRPEDLRVEAEVFESTTREPLPQSPPAPIPPQAVDAPMSFPAVESTPERAPPELARLFAPAPQPAEPSPERLPPSAVTGDSQAFVPPIEIEPPSVRAAGQEIRRSHEVILPASVVLVCEIFVLVGLAFSFIAGLMIGHFIWKVH